ncbi:MAG: N-acetylmuramoyl-L-alanine amidase family protein [Mycoplasmoidaceae bacterium]
MANWLFDYGHGGHDSGAVNGARTEKNDVLKIGRLVDKIMLENGENIRLTRTNDTFLSLEQRCNIEKAGKYDYFVSFHRNAHSSSASGVETYSLSTTGKGRELAEKVQNELKGFFINRGCKTANYYVLKYTNCPAILIEIGFISSSEDNRIFDNNINEIAKAISKALLKQVGKTLNDNKPVPPVTPPTSEKGWRVCIGYYKGYNNAKSALEEAKQKGFTSAYMVEY